MNTKSKTKQMNLAIEKEKINEINKPIVLYKVEIDFEYISYKILFYLHTHIV